MLYTNNVREMSLGLTRMGTGLIADIRDSVPAETFAEIQNRAVHFIPEAIPVGRPGEECNAAIQGNRETRSRRQRPAPQPPTSQPGSQRRQPGSPY